MIREGFYFFFFNDTATTEIYTLSLHDALPIWYVRASPIRARSRAGKSVTSRPKSSIRPEVAGKSPQMTLRSEEHTSELRHLVISYAVFCLKKKNRTGSKLNSSVRSDTAFSRSS